MKTQRNQIEVLIRPGDIDMANQIDTVYEICDAEFPSENSINDQANRIIERNPASGKVIEGLTALFVPLVEKVAKRDALMSGLPIQNFQAVAKKLAEDWDNSYGADYRREQRNAPGL